MKRFCFYVDENDEITIFLLSIPSKAVRGEIMRGIIREWMENVKTGNIKSNYSKYLNCVFEKLENKANVLIGKKTVFNHQNVSKNPDNNINVENPIEAVLEDFGIDGLE
ncbi:hypothetical protein FHQ18_03805 [Deferribacter autotrophicus]|uniref:Uncharacterized protein n=1 Tax=Deferribacter autotrophicus TaxID=500465 RepID=A0A5A8F6A5_9BACT|nr:hypothetical protein [Deferribacter autotrophicus]KAA0259085.1 hypothetical protein FHQ18_03805 [Deferribacter autotrophicus]